MRYPLLLLSILLLAGCSTVQPKYQDYTFGQPQSKLEQSLQPYSGQTQFIEVRGQKEYESNVEQLCRKGYARLGESSFTSKDYWAGWAWDFAKERAQTVGADVVLYGKFEKAGRGSEFKLGFFRKARVPVLGVAVMDASPDWRDHHHYDRAVLVYEVVANTPAARAGLQNGDVIVKLDDTNVGWSADFPTLARSFGGKEVKLEIWRGENKMTTPVKLDSGQ